MRHGRNLQAKKRAIEMIYNGLAVYRYVGVMRMVVVDARDVERW